MSALELKLNVETTYASIQSQLLSRYGVNEEEIFNMRE